MSQESKTGETATSPFPADAVGAGRDPAPPGPVVAATLVAAAAVFAATRALRMGMPPWNDEACNWQRALHFDQHTVSAHELTFRLQQVALAVSDSVVALRAPSLLAGTLAFVLVGLAAWRWVGARAGLVFATLAAVSPYAGFYMTDANHYGLVMLAGGVAVWAGFLWAREAPLWRRGAELAALCGVVYVLAGAHPVVLPVLGAMGAAAIIDMVRRPQAYPLLDRLPEGWDRLAPGALAAFGAAASLYVIADRAAATGIAQRTASGVYLTLSPIFLARVAGEFFGPFLKPGAGQWLAAVTGLAAGAVGLVAVVRRHAGAAPAALAVLVLTAAYGLFFLLQTTAQFFHVKYMAALVPGALLLVAVGMGELLGGRHGRIASVVAGGALGAVLVVNVGWWAGPGRQPVQRSFEAVADLVDGPFADGTVASRSPFIAQALDFLADRHRPGARVVWLGERLPSSLVAAGKARKIAAATGRPVYLVDPAAMGEEVNVDYHRFTRREAELVRRYESLYVDFTGIERALEVRRVDPDPAFGTLPVRGSDAYARNPIYQLLPGREGRPLDGTDRPMIRLRAGGSQSYWLRDPGDAVQIVVRVACERPEFTFVVARANGGDPVVWPMSWPGRPVVLDMELGTGPGTDLQVHLLSGDGTAWMEIGGIREPEGEGVAGYAAREIAPLEAGFSQFLRPGLVDNRRLLGREVTAPAVGNYFVMHEFTMTGLPDVRVRPRVALRGPGAPRIPPPAWQSHTFGDHPARLRLVGVPDTSLAIDTGYDVLFGYTSGPATGSLLARPARVFALEPRR